MSAGLILGVALAYFILLLVIAWYTSRGADERSFFIGNKKSRWYIVAYGMIGTS